jgi:hypothetical protein
MSLVRAGRFCPNRGDCLDKLGMGTTEEDIKREMDVESKTQALADYLKRDPKEVSLCTTRVNDLSTFQVGKEIYLVGTEEDVDAGIRGYFQNNLGEIDSAFIGREASLSEEDARVVDRICEVMDEEFETDLLNEALLKVVDRCGNLDALVRAATAEVDRGEFLSLDSKEISFGKYLIYRFKEGQCSDFDQAG